MATQDDVRRIALALPETIESDNDFAFHVVVKGKRKGLLWLWKERADPKKTRVPNPHVIALRVKNEIEKEMMLAADAGKFFTEPHYDGYPAVLVRLAAVDVKELEALLRGAWRAQAPPALVKSFDEARSAQSTRATTKRSATTTKRKPAAK